MCPQESLPEVLTTAVTEKSEDVLLPFYTQAAFNPESLFSEMILPKGAPFLQVGALHSPQDIRVIFCCSTRLIVETGTESLSLKQGQYTLISGNMSLQIANPTNKKAIVCIGRFPASWLPGILPETHAIFSMLQSSHWLNPAPVEANLQFMLSALRQPGIRKGYAPAWSAIKLAEMLLYIAQQQELLLANTSVNGSRLSELDQQRVKMVQDILAKDPQLHIPISELARIAGTNENYLKKHFKQITGTTIYAYLMEQRMLRAQLLITQGEKDFAVLLKQCGYKRKQDFVEAFKRYFGFAPFLKVLPYIMINYEIVSIL